MERNDHDAELLPQKPQPAPEPQPLTREELRRHGLPSDWNERLRSGGGGAKHFGQTYRRR